MTPVASKMLMLRYCRIGFSNLCTGRNQRTEMAWRIHGCWHRRLQLD